MYVLDLVLKVVEDVVKVVVDVVVIAEVVVVVVVVVEVVRVVVIVVDESVVIIIPVEVGYPEVPEAGVLVEVEIGLIVGGVQMLLAHILTNLRHHYILICDGAVLFIMQHNICLYFKTLDKA